MTSSISSLVKIWKIRHSGPGCSFVWTLRVVYFPVKHSRLYNTMGQTCPRLRLRCKIDKIWLTFSNSFFMSWKKWVKIDNTFLSIWQFTWFLHLGALGLFRIRTKILRCDFSTLPKRQQNHRDSVPLSVGIEIWKWKQY